MLNSSEKTCRWGIFCGKVFADRVTYWKACVSQCGDRRWEVGEACTKIAHAGKRTPTLDHYWHDVSRFLACSAVIRTVNEKRRERDKKRERERERIRGLRGPGRNIYSDVFTRPFLRVRLRYFFHMHFRPWQILCIIWKKIRSVKSFFVKIFKILFFQQYEILFSSVNLLFILTLPSIKCPNSSKGTSGKYAIKNCCCYGKILERRVKYLA